MAVSISPVFNIPQFFDGNGKPLAGGLIHAYSAGSFSVLANTYTDNTGTVANTNPIVLNASGQLTTDIWLTDGSAYQLVLTDSSGTTVIKAVDDVVGVQATTSTPGGTTPTMSVWQALAGATYLTTTSFSVTGNETIPLAVGNRVRCTVATGYVYGTVLSVAFATTTNATVILDNGATLDSSLSLVEYSLLIQSGRTVDAGAVTYNTTPTPAASTVSAALQSLTSSDATINGRIDALRKVWTASGTNTYAISPSPAVSSYAADSVFTVRFTSANSGASTLSVSGLTALSLSQYDASGALVAPTIRAGQVSDVAYNGSQFVLLDAVPAAAAGATPRGMSVYLSNDTFVTPAGVYYLKVTCVGAGGGGGGGATRGGVDAINWTGGAGAAGGVAVSYLSTTPGTSYSVGVGLGGAGGAVYQGGTAGGTSSFGITLVQGYGGGAGTMATTNSNGTPGTQGGGSGQLVTYDAPRPYGQPGVGGVGGTQAGTSGTNGFVTVEF